MLCYVPCPISTGIPMSSKPSEMQLSQLKKAMPENATICSPTVCVSTTLSAEQLKVHASSIMATFVDRKAPGDSDKPLMKSTGFLAILQAGDSVNMKDITQIDTATISLAKHHSYQILTPPELIVKAKWFHRSVEAGSSGRDASVFGALGVFSTYLDIPLIAIPKMSALNVSPQFLRKYGAKLIPLDRTFQLAPCKEPKLKTLYMTEYTWTEGYIPEYVMHPEGGGGLFVETHPFEHVFTPLEPGCGGALILGVKQGVGFRFCAFEIPYGYSMQIDANVIHGDSFFTGKYAIALTETEFADSVLMKTGLPNDRAIQPVIQQSVYLQIPFNLSLRAKINSDFLLCDIVSSAKRNQPLALAYLACRFFNGESAKSKRAIEYLSKKDDKQEDKIVELPPSKSLK
jgi:hypothetical protein